LADLDEPRQMEDVAATVELTAVPHALQVSAVAFIPSPQTRFLARLTVSVYEAGVPSGVPAASVAVLWLAASVLLHPPEDTRGIVFGAAATVWLQRVVASSRQARAGAVRAPIANGWYMPLLDVGRQLRPRTTRREGFDEQPEQDAGSCTGRPCGAADHPVRVHEMAVARPARDPQHARYRSLTRTQDRTDQQGLSVPPRPVDEQRSERQDDPDGAGGQVRHAASLARDTTSLSIKPASSPSAFHARSKWPKSS